MEKLKRRRFLERKSKRRTQVEDALRGFSSSIITSASLDICISAKMSWLEGTKWSIDSSGVPAKVPCSPAVSVLSCFLHVDLGTTPHGNEIASHPVASSTNNKFLEFHHRQMYLLQTTQSTSNRFLDGLYSFLGDPFKLLQTVLHCSIDFSSTSTFSR